MLTDVGLKILFLAIPGITAFFVVKSLGPKRPRTDFESALQIFLYGIVSYAIAGALEGGYGWYAATNPRPAFWGEVWKNVVELAILNSQTGLSAGSIIFATAVAIVMCLGIAVLQTHIIPHRIFRALEITARTGEVDMWGFTFNTPNLDSWVTVRHPSGKVYQGWVRGYSDGGDEREIVMADVRVYVASNTNPNELLEVDSIPVLYLGLDRKNSVVEFREAQ